MAGSEKKTGLYENWLKHFTINIMTQSFHAFILMFVINMLGVINKMEYEARFDLLNPNDSILSIMSIVGMMAIIKFEKLFKDLFGMKDSMAGSLKASGAQMIAGMKSAQTFGGEIKKPFTNLSSSRRKMTSLGNEVRKSNPKIDFENGHYIKTTGGAGSGAAGATSERSPLSDKTQDLYNKMKDAKKNGDMDAYKDYRDHAVTQMKYEKAVAGAGAGGGAGIGGGGGYGAGGGTGGRSESDVENKKKQIQEYNDSVLDYRKSKRKVLAQSAVNLASLTMGMGGTDTMGDAVIAANIINNPMNAAANRHIDHGENIVARKSTGDSDRYTERTIGEAIKRGFDRASAGSRNENGKINPVKLTVQNAVSYAAVPFKAVGTATRHSKVDNIDDV